MATGFGGRGNELNEQIHLIKRRFAACWQPELPVAQPTQTHDLIPLSDAFRYMDQRRATHLQIHYASVFIVNVVF